MADLERVLARLDGGLDGAVEHLFDLVRIASISTDPAYAGKCMEAAEWLAVDLGSMGLSAQIHATPGRPIVTGHHAGPQGSPHVLFYGHYDVQPVDPPELWRTPPFEPRIETGEDGVRRLIGRGISDDKGQLMTFVEALRAFAAEGGVPLSITVLLEGEEESGSASLRPFLLEHAQELKADIALVCDTNMWDRNTPAVTTALRGLVGEEVRIYGASRDLHSGLYGSAAANPIHILTTILAGMRGENGEITLPGFYDGVHETPPEILRGWEALGVDAEKFLGEAGLSIPAGERGRSVLEQVWARPTAEVNGIFGGYQQEGFKTVIPAMAGAKISFRLVGDQDPDKIRSSFREYVRSRLPADCSVDFTEFGGSPAISLDMSLPQLHMARNALEEEWGVQPALIAMGGSIPVVSEFKTLLGMDSLLVGFGLPGDNIHSPNEQYDLQSFHKGMRSWARIIAALTQSGRSGA